MKKAIKIMLTALAVCSLSAVAVTVSGCGKIDEYKTKIEQLECNHEWTEGEETKAATCTENGEWSKTCTVCGLEKQDVIRALGHREIVLSAIPATCTKDGLTAGKQCSTCDTVLVQQETVAALGHTEVVLPAASATCTEDGLTEGKQCSVCDTVLVPQETVPGAHAYNNGICTSCNYVDVAKVDTSLMTEKTLEVGEKVANGFYRFYLTDSNFENGYMKVSSSDNWYIASYACYAMLIYIGEDPVEYAEIDYNSVDGFTQKGGDSIMDGYIITSSWIDIYIGTFSYTDDLYGTFTVDENTTFVEYGNGITIDNTTVKRLVME